MSKVDVAINVFGKPYQTAISLLSLLKYSKQHINRIFFTEETKQSHEDDGAKALDFLPKDLIVYYKPKYYLSFQYLDMDKLNTDAEYRQSIRYQYAWEHSDKDYLFLMHNDCLFTNDIIGNMLPMIQSDKCAGVGTVGQCWNCPACHAGLCDGTKYKSFNPTYEEAIEIVRNFPGRRTKEEYIDKEHPMPFTECRLNEFAALIHLGRTRHLVIPHGNSLLFGCYGIDIGSQWFKSMILLGFNFTNYPDLSFHGPFTAHNGGYALDHDKQRYLEAESQAKTYLEQHYDGVVR